VISPSSLDFYKTKRRTVQHCAPLPIGVLYHRRCEIFDLLVLTSALRQPALMTPPIETDVENWRSRVADSRWALIVAQRRLDDALQDLAAIRRDLREARARLDAIEAAASD
jgi:hypothetical protein